MKINCATENFRDMLTGEMDSAETTHGIVLDGNDYDGLADEFAGDVLNGLTAAGVEWSRCYSQSVGAMVAVQSATEAELDAFDAAVDAARPAIAKKIDEFVRLAKEAEAKMTTTKTIQINYLDRAGNLMHSYSTGDEYTAEEIAAWEESLNDMSCTHPEAPDDWDQFALVATDAE